MSKTVIRPVKAPAAVGPYSPAIRTGDFLFCSGQIPLDPATGTMVPGGIAEQTERVMLNIQAILEDQSLSWASVVKTTVFMTNLGDFSAMNDVYGRFFPSAPPARSTVQVAALPKEAMVEIEVVAHY